MVREYQREGDRVRYFSLERSGVGGNPGNHGGLGCHRKSKSGTRDSQQKQLDEQIAKTENAQRFADLDVDTSFEVHPNVFLPDGRRILCRRWKECRRCETGGSHSPPGERREHLNES